MVFGPWAAARVLFAAILLSVAVPGRAEAPETPFSDVFAQLAARLVGVVVNISTTQAAAAPAVKGGPESQPPSPGAPLEDFFRDFFGEKGGHGGPAPPIPRIASLGSGFIIDPSGLVVTNNHVIANAEQITVTLSDDTTLQAEVIGRDAVTDLALLKVEPKAPLPAAMWGDSNKTKVGDWVLAIGNPFGLGGTVTSGIISATARDIHSSPYDDFLQTDASINRGNSGGPMFNLAGEVIGINTAIFSPSGGSIGIRQTDHRSVAGLGQSGTWLDRRPHSTSHGRACRGRGPGQGSWGDDCRGRSIKSCGAGKAAARRCDPRV